MAARPATGIPASGDAAPLPLLTAAEMRAWDDAAIRGMGIPERLLMENAGRAAAAVAARLFPEGRVVAAVGAGNNGGDAVVMLRTLRSWGRQVAAVPVGSAALPDDLLRGWEIPVERALSAACTGAGVVVDGILGTGARGPLRSPVAEAIGAIKGSGRPVLALDGPTGVDLTDGSAVDGAVHADVTVTFGAAKRGLLLHPGRAHAGRVIVVEVGFPPLGAESASAALITDAWAAARLPKIPPDAHKGTAGEVLVIAGGGGMAGAAIMVAMGTLRSGAGLVRVASSPENRTAVNAAAPEAIFIPLARAADALGRADAVVCGPGIGVGPAARDLVATVLEAGVPAVLDADALTLLASEPGLRDSSHARVLITPHPGEMARLMETRIDAITADPIGTAAAAAERFACTVLLKGAPSVVAAPDAPVLVGSAGHSGIATGGMGDTLAGVAGAFLAAGAGTRDAAALALHLAGRAAELAGRGRSLLPRDVAEALPDAFDRAGAPLAHPIPGIVLDLPGAR